MDFTNILRRGDATGRHANHFRGNDAAKHAHPLLAANGGADISKYAGMRFVHTRLKSVLSESDAEMVSRELGFLKDRMEGKRRRSGAPAIAHIAKVAVDYANMCMRSGAFDRDGLLASAHHDTDEELVLSRYSREDDREYARERYANRIGEAAYGIVRLLSHESGMAVEEYTRSYLIGQVFTDERAIDIKKADTHANLLELGNMPQEKIIRSAQKAIAFFTLLERAGKADASDSYTLHLLHSFIHGNVSMNVRYFHADYYNMCNSMAPSGADLAFGI